MARPDDPRGGERPLFTSRRHERDRSRRRLIWVLSLVAIIAAGAALGVVWRRSRGPNGMGPSTTVAADPATPDSAAADEPIDLPELDASDEVVRTLVAGLSSRPEWASWLVSDDMVRRFVVAVTAVADGRSPESQLDFLAPEEPFRARRSGVGMTVDPSSYHRYDALAATFASLDTRGVAKLYRQLHPLMDDAFRELGLGDRTFDETLRRAFDRLVTTPVPSSPPEVDLVEGRYVYTAPGIEGLSPAEKHLLRMGPDNARLVQAKLHELQSALGLRG